MENYKDLGKIVLVKNIIFRNSDGTTIVDHSYKKGRPCVFIGELEDYYYIPIFSSRVLKKYQDYCIPINENNDLEYGRLEKKCCLSITQIIKKQLNFYSWEVAQLTSKMYYQLIQKILTCDRMETPDTFLEIQEALNRQKEDLEKRYSYHI